jgi:hypothetical protein
MAVVYGRGWDAVAPGARLAGKLLEWSWHVLCWMCEV